MARKKATLDAFKPFFAVVDDRGREYERTADFAEGLDMVRSTAAQRGGAALVDGNALPQTRPTTAPRAARAPTSPKRCS